MHIVPNATVTIFEPGGTTPLAQTIYAAATGGTTLSNPFVTDADGLIDFYLDDAQDVKVTATGTGVGTITADNVHVLPPADEILARDFAISEVVDPVVQFQNTFTGVSSITVTAVGSGYSSTPSVVFTGGGGSGASATAIRTGTTVTSVVMNNPGTGYTSPPAISFSGGGGSGVTATASLESTTFSLMPAAGSLPILWAGRTQTGNDGVSINDVNGSRPITSKLLVASARSTSFINAYFIHNPQGTAGTSDSSALTAAITNIVSGGNTLMRALEGRTILLAPAVINGAWALELNVTSDVPGTIPTHLVGAFIGSGTTHPGEVPIDSGIWFGGPAGIKNFLYMTNTAGNLVARIAGGVSAGDSAGDVMTIANLYSTLTIGGAFRVGIVNAEAAGSGQTFAGMSYDAGTNINALIINALTGGTGYRNILLAPSSGSVGIGVSTAQLAAGVGGAGVGALPTMLYVDGTIGAAAQMVLAQIATPSAPNTGYTALYMKGSGVLASRAAGGAEQVHRRDGQYGIAVGTTGSVTTASTTYTDLLIATAGAALAVTLTTTGGDLFVRFNGAFTHGSAGAAIVVALSLDGAAEVFSMSLNLPNASQALPISISAARFTGVAAGSHTVKVRWLTSTGTATSNATERYLLVEEQPH